MSAPGAPMTRRELFGLLRPRASATRATEADAASAPPGVTSAPPGPAAGPPIALPVLAPVWLADDQPFSLDSFYAARAEARRR